MEKTYKYDAFISYRHVSPDKPVAERLQKLLETYVPPKGVLADGEKKKLHLFRDETELPTSNDLGGDIRRALEDSRFLVVICSPEYEKSKWCMEEVRYFKELHGGSNRNILTILADDPDKRPAFPEELRFENVTETLENGETVTTRREIEPLAANVCAKTEGQMLKKLKTEFLRIAAPLLGCGYDDLYHREQRRAAQRKLRIAFGTAAVLAVGVLLSTAALLTIRAKNQQIAADALELRKNNAELLLKESEMLEKDGDLYGALQAAADAFPEDGDGFEPACGTLSQLASLTGAYEPRSFAPVNRFNLSFRPKKICLLEGGKRLAVVTAEGLILIDTDSGETLKTFLDYGDSLVESNVVFYHDLQINNASCSYYIPNVPVPNMRNGSVYYGSFSKDIAEEIQPVGNAIYIRDTRTIPNTNVIERISPETGDVIWSYSEDASVTLLIKHCSGESVFLERTRDNVTDLMLLSADTGEILATIDCDEIASHFSDSSAFSYRVFYSNDHLVIVYKRQFCVFRRSEDIFTFLSVGDLFPGKYPNDSIELTFLIRDETVFVMGCAYTGYWDSTALIAGFDLNTGELKWEHEDVHYNTGAPYLVCIEPNKRTNNNDFGVVVGVEGDRLFSVNAETGAEICRTTLPDAVLELYCAESGYLFMTSADGSEIMTAIRNITDASDHINLLLNRDFSTDIKLAAYCNNLYAVCRNNDPAVILYRFIENGARDTLSRSVNEDQPLWDVVFSPDDKVALLYENLTAKRGDTLGYGSEKQFRIIDVASKETLQTVPLGTDNYKLSFLDSEHVAVTQLHSISVYSIKTGEKVLELTDDTYITDTDRIAFSSAGEIYISDTKGVIWRVRPGETPEEVSELKLCGESDGDVVNSQRLQKMFASHVGNKLFLWMEISSTTYAVTETGTGEDASTRVEVVQEETAGHIYAYDTVTKTVTECSARESLDPSKLSSCVFTADESAVYLLFSDNTVTGFSCETGEQLCLAKFEGNSTALITLRNDLCIVNTEGDLIKIRAQGAELAPQGKLSLADETLAGLSFTYTPMQNGRGLLRYGKSYGWLIDENAFAVVGDINKCCGIDEESGLVYQSYYDYLYSYQLRSDVDLLALAKARLGE